MIRHVLSNIQDVEIYPLISLGIFTVFFVALAVYVFTMDKGYVSKMSNMPLDVQNEEKSI